MKKYLMSLTAIVIIIGISFLYFGTDNYNSKNYIEKLIQKHNPQGATVIVLDDYEIKEVKNYGYANVENKTFVNVNTQFKIASISKSITAYGIMQLVDNGELKLDEPYIKEYSALAEEDMDCARVHMCFGKGRRQNKSPNTAPPRISTAPAICTALIVSFKKVTEKMTADSGSR